MRIWDVSPGYLNDRSLLGEHRELHGIVSIVKNRKLGYSRHPETLRWKEFGWALQQRHRLLCAEMSLRGFNEQTVVDLRTQRGRWPQTYIDEPCAQYAILRRKYSDKSSGRIPLPRNAQELWAQHKYSVMARDPRRYRSLGQTVASMRRGADWCALSAELTVILRRPPPAKSLFNALQHMWGYVADYADAATKRKRHAARSLLSHTQCLARAHGVEYLLHSTALSELEAWIKK